MIGFKVNQALLQQAGMASPEFTKELTEGEGPFAKLGKETCDEYWRNFEKNAKKRKYNSVKEFLKWRGKKK